ncbi:MAG TPA: hypothetical protein VF297_06760 [Pyrinomonadaceae bacterium]
MSDEQGEPKTTAEGPGSLLTARLLSRGTDSLGLIDVRGAERHYARIMDWLAARNPLLEHLRTRYGLTEGEGMTGLAFAEPMNREGARDGGENINLSATSASNFNAAPVSQTAPAAEQIFTLAAHVPDDSADAAPTETKRIARRGVPTFSPARPDPDPDAGASRVRGEVVSQEQGEAFKPLVELTVPTHERARDLQSPSPFKETHAANSESSDSAQTPRPRHAPNPAQESTLSHAPRTVPSVEERVTPSTTEQDRPRARGSTGTSDAAVVNNPTAAATPGVPRVNESRVNESTGADAVPLVPASRAQVGTRERVDASGAVVVNEAQGTTLNKSVAAEGMNIIAEGAKGTGVKLPVAGETRTASASFATPRPLAQARELRAPAGETHEFAGDSVRASGYQRAQPPLPLAANPAAVERVEPSHQRGDDKPAVKHASSSGVTETFTPGRAAAPADDINVQRLTEQVSRHLARRLLVERERRGLGRK